MPAIPPVCRRASNNRKHTRNSAVGPIPARAARRETPHRGTFETAASGRVQTSAVPARIPPTVAPLVPGSVASSGRRKRSEGQTRGLSRARPKRGKKEVVGAVRFELTTSCTRNKRASQATLRPDSRPYICTAPPKKSTGIFARGPRHSGRAPGHALRREVATANSVRPEPGHDRVGPITGSHPDATAEVHRSHRTHGRAFATGSHSRAWFPGEQAGSAVRRCRHGSLGKGSGALAPSAESVNARETPVGFAGSADRDHAGWAIRS